VVIAAAAAAAAAVRGGEIEIDVIQLLDPLRERRCSQLRDFV
jgi:hypothetical protein